MPPRMPLFVLDAGAFCWNAMDQLYIINFAKARFSGLYRIILEGKMERVKGFEPSTSTLARLRSTPELHSRSLDRFGDL